MIKQWLVLTIQIPNEYGEALSNFLMEEGATGIHEVDGDSDVTRLRTYFPQTVNERELLPRVRSFLKSLQTIFPGRSAPGSGLVAQARGKHAERGEIPGKPLYRRRPDFYGHAQILLCIVHSEKIFPILAL